ncbi:MAG: hypothetical protein AB1758_32900 [Candidatus Eremiobacterota bacterium]
MKQTELVSASPENQQILDLCVAIAHGERSCLEALREKASHRLQELDEAIDDFFGQVDRQGEEYTARFRAELEEVASRFHDYGSALRAILACIEAGAPPGPLRSHASVLSEASHLLRMAVGRYEQADLSVGPSRYPLVNILENLVRSLRTGQAGDVWPETCRQYGLYYRAMLEEIQQSEHRAGPGVPERERAVSRIVDLFGQLENLGPKDPEGSYSSLLAELTGAHLDLEQAFHTYNEAVLTREPTRSPQVNLVLNTVAGYRSGRYTAVATKAVLEGYLQIVRTGMQDLQPALQAPPESALLCESAAQLLEAMESVEDALLVLLELVEDPDTDPQRVQEALTRLKESGEKGAAAAGVAREFNESAGKVACTHCSTLHPMEARVCSHCSRPLPLAWFRARATMEVREGGTGPGPDFHQETVMTDVIKLLFDRCDAYEKGEVEAQGLVELLDAREAVIRRAREKLSVLRAPDLPQEASAEERAVSEQFVHLAEDALDLLRSGLEQCQEGLSKIRQAMETGDFGLMDGGRGCYFEGCQKIWEVWRLDNALDAYLEEEEVVASG